MVCDVFTGSDIQDLKVRTPFGDFNQNRVVKRFGTRNNKRLQAWLQEIKGRCDLGAHVHLKPLEPAQINLGLDLIKVALTKVEHFAEHQRLGRHAIVEMLGFGGCKLVKRSLVGEKEFLPKNLFCNAMKKFVNKQAGVKHAQCGLWLAFFFHSEGSLHSHLSSLLVSVHEHSMAVRKWFPANRSLFSRHHSILSISIDDNFMNQLWDLKDGWLRNWSWLRKCWLVGGSQNWLRKWQFQRCIDKPTELWRCDCWSQREPLQRQFETVKVGNSWSEGRGGALDGAR